MAGFAGVTQHLGCAPAVLIREDRLQVVYYLPAGRLSFELEAQRDVEPFTQNLMSYGAVWQPVIPIPDATIDGIPLQDLSARIDDLRFIEDITGPAYKTAVAATQDWIARIIKAVKPEQLFALEALAARYLLEFDFGIKTAGQLRRQLMSESRITMQFSLTASPRVLPLDAWYALQKSTDRKPRRKQTPVNE